MFPQLFYFAFLNIILILQRTINMDLACMVQRVLQNTPTMV